MRIAIIEAGLPPAPLVGAFGDYPAMVRALLGPDHSYVTCRAFAGELPDERDAFDACVITGATAGVNDDLPWIAPLAAFVRALRGRAKLVGICFGHQLIAHAFGGTVQKAAQGWGVGRHRYTLADGALPFAAARTLDVIASHQDQVTVAPRDAVVLGGSAFTPNAMLAYRDGAAISLQSHPEFDAGFARALLASREASDLDDATRAAALRSLDQPVDTLVARRWIADYLADCRPS